MSGRVAAACHRPGCCMARRVRLPAFVAVVLVFAALPGLSLAGHFGASTFIREAISLPTTTPTEAQFLTGAAGAGAVIGIHLTVPTPVPSRVPAVVLLHGSTGVTPAIHRWATELATVLGVAVATVDSFNARGVAVRRVKEFLISALGA